MYLCLYFTVAFRLGPLFVPPSSGSRLACRWLLSPIDYYKTSSSSLSVSSRSLSSSSLSITNHHGLPANSHHDKIPPWCEYVSYGSSSSSSVSSSSCMWKSKGGEKNLHDNAASQSVTARLLLSQPSYHIGPPLK